MQLVDVIADSKRLLGRGLLAVRALHGQADREELLKHLIMHVRTERTVDISGSVNGMLAVHLDPPERIVSVAPAEQRGAVVHNPTMVVNPAG